jgi:hypothetical protein
VVAVGVAEGVSVTGTEITAGCAAVEVDGGDLATLRFFVERNAAGSTGQTTRTITGSSEHLS